MLPREYPHPTLEKNHPLSRRDRPPDRCTSLSCVQALLLQLHHLRTLLDNLLAFRQDEFDVAGIGHVGIDL